MLIYDFEVRYICSRFCCAPFVSLEHRRGCRLRTLYLRAIGISSEGIFSGLSFLDSLPREFLDIKTHLWPARLETCLFIVHVSSVKVDKLHLREQIDIRGVLN